MSDAAPIARQKLHQLIEMLKHSQILADELKLDRVAIDIAAALERALAKLDR